MTATPLTRPSISLAMPLRVGAVGSLCLIVLLVLWMHFTMIAGAVISSGQAVVHGKPKVVQSLDGGVVEEVFVHDGDAVKAGQTLLRLDPTLLKINLDIYRNRLAEVYAREARLQAEYLGLEKITFPAAPKQLDDVSTELQKIGQIEIFEARREVLAGKQEQLSERILQFENQIDGIEGRLESTRNQLEFIQSELATVRGLKNKGLARESQVLELQRSEAQLLGDLAERQADLARIKNSIRDTELESVQTEREFKEQVVTELREATATYQELILQIVTVEKQLDRVEILAPVDGVVHEMRVFNAGGVISPDGVILEIIPVAEGVDFELRVDPKSIDQVFVGQTARVVFPAFNSRTTPEIFGSVKTISPTSISDPMTGQSYYRIELSVPPDQLALLGEAEVIPGMPIEAFLQTGERSVLSYLTKPLMDQIGLAFRDD
ncbi:HlyD family type I secretion periplasmic adaptor subunit [Frigidibacter sp. ROC022]|uniref:HlyD family type I secretion periplasmic adaptor subunit n=1 Tax=Frigidibacter sp. ROC022 TaxID=2971796 RepID=UPI00215B0FD8|nr:HlyD family type I secretion periplasmic adaptor subunit [Frigidibacter sp. ROC022]MCR8726791.1 HlyD family type I secretion periplasmic adaptor subunit [Frigidibacter sp. ROC022]